MSRERQCVRYKGQGLDETGVQRLESRDWSPREWTGQCSARSEARFALLVCKLPLRALRSGSHSVPHQIPQRPYALPGASPLPSPRCHPSLTSVAYLAAPSPPLPAFLSSLYYSDPFWLSVSLRSFDSLPAPSLPHPPAPSPPSPTLPLQQLSLSLINLSESVRSVAAGPYELCSESLVPALCLFKPLRRLSFLVKDTNITANQVVKSERQPFATHFEISF